MRLFAPLLLSLLLAACGEGEPLTPPDARLPDGSHYRGEIVAGLLQGPGRLDYANGAWFEGQFKDGQFQGRGEWHGQFGETYVGEFAQGLFDGKGLIEYSDGSRYQGRFVQGMPQGQGVRTDADGNQYSGTFKDGALDGQGSFQGTDGERYDGAFRRELFHGQGRYQSAEGDVWHGRFRDGSPSGKGEYQGADGEHYQGQFRDWRYEGLGELRRADRSRYQGHFAHGLFDGKGTLTLADRSQQSGTWQNGRLLRDDQGKTLPDPLERGLLAQGRLLDEAIAALPYSTDQVELYALTLAGDGKQSVFLREADYVQRLLVERFAARGHISLVNHRDHLDDRPMATRESLARAIQALAERSGKEDLIFLYLTSHGSAEHELVLSQPRLQLANLPATELAALLEPLKDRYKVLVISACYSGGFIAPLKDEMTLVMTAARADRTSFGCSEDSDFTYFGRALFAEALQQTDDLQQAFALARQRVAEREAAEGFSPSEPQIWPAKAVLRQWNARRQSQPRQENTGSGNLR